MVLVRRLRRTPVGRRPTLLVVRVFQRDRAMRALFDTVIERWRLSKKGLTWRSTQPATVRLFDHPPVAFAYEHLFSIGAGR